MRIGYRTTRSEETRCYFCKNNCLRTFIDVNIGDAEAVFAAAGLQVEGAAAGR